MNNNSEQEWQWCLVGNIVEEHEYGEEHVIKYGNKQFRPNAKVYINLVYGGMGHESVVVIGRPRRSNKYIEIVTARKYIYNFRLQKVYKPVILKKMKNSEWDWWGNTDEARASIINALEWLNRKEAMKEKDKWLNSGTEDCESEYIKKMRNMVDQIPKRAPIDWDCYTIPVDNLMYVGFSRVQTEKLICISAQARYVINCETMRKTSCDINYNENTLTASAEGFGDEIISISGDMGGILSASNRKDIFIQSFWPYWPKEQIILSRRLHTPYDAPDECCNIYEGYGLKACEFSSCGIYFVIATESKLMIYKNKEMEIVEKARKNREMELLRKVSEPDFPKRSWRRFLQNWRIWKK